MLLLIVMPKFLVKHSGKTHDVSRFLSLHPGGKNTLRPFEGCDITTQLEKTHHHSPAAYDLLKDYRVRDENDKSQEFDLEVRYFNRVDLQFSIFYAGRYNYVYYFHFILPEFGQLGQSYVLASRFFGFGLQ